MKKENQIEDIYECESCGATSSVPVQCCGRPMKKKDKGSDK